jgi:hypothetical protein
MERKLLLSLTPLLFALALGVSASGCSKKMESPDAFSPADMAKERGEAAPADGAVREAQQPAGGEAEKGEKPPAKAGLPRKIIYTANIRLMVEDLGKAERELEKLIDANQGYLVQSQVQGAPGVRRSGEWKTRIPAGRFKAFQAAVLKLGEQQSSSVDSQDVTGEYYDLKTRIKNREAREAALRQMYADWSKKALKPADLKPIDTDLDEVRKEIERAKGRLEVLSELSAMATATIYLSERTGFVPPESPPFGTRAGRTFSGSLGALEDFGQALALFGIALAPWLPLIAVVVVAAWVLIRRARRRPAAATPAAVAPTVLEVAEPSRPPQESGGVGPTP